MFKRFPMLDTLSIVSDAIPVGAILDAHKPTPNLQSKTRPCLLQKGKMMGRTPNKFKESRILTPQLKQAF
jgi:hypothetical protein